MPLRSLVLLALPSSALAVDLDALVESWTTTVSGQDGSDGVDEATDVALTLTNDLIVTGFLDGAVDHMHDGYIVAWGADTTERWSVTVDAGAVGPNQLGSDDRVQAIDIEPVTEAITWCGATGATGFAPDPLGWYWVESLEPSPLGSAYPPLLDWDLTYSDGQSSPLQSCHGVDRGSGYTYAAGWSQHGADEGRWLSWRFVDSSGLADPPYTFEYAGFPAVPDQAYDVSASSATGQFVVVGTQGFSGLPGSDLNDTDWYVRLYDAAGTLAWEHLYRGGEQLEDKALATVYDPSNQVVYVAGFENGGSDNAGGSDRGWLVIAYDQDGDGLGGPDILWTHRFGEGSGADEVATSLVLDESGDLLVGGSTVDPTSGHEIWRVSKLSFYDGVELQSWEGVDHGGDSRVQGIDYRNGKLALAGYAHDGTSRQFAAALLEDDRDADGIGDSVDACPDDPLKAADTGVCGCNVPDTDTDGDGFENCVEDCPTDPNKQEPGVCGCEEPDDDTDEDGTFDCEDDCPGDPGKIAWGICGCNTPDDDTDGDGIVDCQDSCSDTPAGAAVDAAGCPVGPATGDTGAPATTDGGKGGGGGGGCGCSSAPPTGLIMPLFMLLAGYRRRMSLDLRRTGS
ncbi:MAG TPA: hypothetical protein ENK18_13495 [Deltaproteobacteria bacterium]|nr:hypothetical protein [Deltaproteobacteria bacterium]